MSTPPGRGPRRRSGVRTRAIAAGVVLLGGLALLQILLRVGWFPNEPLREHLAVVLIAAVVLFAPVRPLTTLVIVLLVVVGMWVDSQRAPQLLIAAIVLAAYYGGRSRHPLAALVLAACAAGFPLVLTVGDLVWLLPQMVTSNLTTDEVMETLVGPYGMLAIRRSWGGGLLDLLIVAIAGIVTILGRSLTRADEESRAAHAANHRLVLMQERERERVIAEERVAISRDVHDIVAHHVTAMVLRAQSAEHAASVRPEVASEALADIRIAGTEALGSLRDVLERLRGVSNPTRPFGEQLDGVVHRVRAAGIDVDVRIAPDLDLGATLVEPVVRIVSEALTNTIRHSTATHTIIRLLRSGPTEVVVGIDDDGGTRRGGSDTSPGPGLGLVGMTERLHALGGHLRYGWRDPVRERYWFVEARLPGASAGNVPTHGRAHLIGSIEGVADHEDGST